MDNHTLKTVLLLRVGEAESEYSATITYHRHKAYDGGREEPSSDAYCEVVGITLDFTPTKRIPLDDLIVAELQDQLQPELMEAWADDDAAAADYRSEARRDALMMERF